MARDLIVAFDPGDTTGWAELLMDGRLIDWGQGNTDDIIEYLSKCDFSHIAAIVCEDWKLDAWRARQQGGSSMKATQVIGMIKLEAKRNKIPLVLQNRQVLAVAEKFSGKKPKGAHSESHRVDAYNHGFYYLVKNHRHLVKTALERRNGTT